MLLELAAVRMYLSSHPFLYVAPTLSNLIFIVFGKIIQIHNINNRSATSGARLQRVPT